MPPSPQPPATSSDARTSPTVSVVIPALNEESNLPLVLEGLPEVDEVVIVDGGSADDTVAVAREVRPDAVVVRQTRTGKGNALVCGFAASRGDIVITLNADGSTDPGEIPRYIDALVSGAEVAHGSRYREGGGDLGGHRLDRLGNILLSWFVNMLFGTRFTDLGYGYNAYWRALLPALDLPAIDQPGLKRGRRVWGDGPEIEPLLNIRVAAQGMRVVEVASIGYPPIHGTRDHQLIGRGWRAVRAAFSEYARRWRLGRRPAAPGRPVSVPSSAGAPVSQLDTAARARPRGTGTQTRPGRGAPRRPGGLPRPAPGETGSFDRPAPGETGRYIRPVPDEGFPRSTSTDAGSRARSGTSDTGSFPRPSDTGSFPRPSDTGSFPRPTETGSFPRPTETGSFPRPTDTGGFPRPSDTGSFPRATDTGDFPHASDTGNFPRPSETGSFPRPVPGETGSFPRPSETGSIPLPIPGETGSFRRPGPSDTGSHARPDIADVGGGAAQVRRDTDSGSHARPDTRAYPAPGDTSSRIPRPTDSGSHARPDTSAYSAGDTGSRLQRPADGGSHARRDAGAPGTGSRSLRDRDSGSRSRRDLTDTGSHARPDPAGDPRAAPGDGSDTGSRRRPDWSDLTETGSHARPDTGGRPRPRPGDPADAGRGTGGRPRPGDPAGAGSGTGGRRRPDWHDLTDTGARPLPDPATTGTGLTPGADPNQDWRETTDTGSGPRPNWQQMGRTPGRPRRRESPDGGDWRDLTSAPRPTSDGPRYDPLAEEQHDVDPEARRSLPMYPAADPSWTAVLGRHAKISEATADQLRRWLPRQRSSQGDPSGRGGRPDDPASDRAGRPGNPGSGSTDDADLRLAAGRRGRPDGARNRPSPPDRGDRPGPAERSARSNPADRGARANPADRAARSHAPIESSPDAEPASPSRLAEAGWLSWVGQSSRSFEASGDRWPSESDHARAAPGSSNATMGGTGQGGVHEVGEARRRLDGRPDLTVIDGEGARGGTPAQLRAVPGERYGK